ncbi:MAG: DUF192 domain-containing protein [Nitrospirota bacterium]|nr:DUF192 domain-containing protein [Nitrospirota bacterium]
MICKLLSLTIIISALLFNAHTITADGGVKKISIRRSSTPVAVFAVETVSGQKEKEKGLAERAPIPSDCGMLFILDAARPQFFWMKGMKFSLDILFFNKDKILTGILPGLRPCTECTIYKAPEGTAYALEIKAGMADKLGIKTGDRLEYENR